MHLFCLIFKNCEGLERTISSASSIIITSFGWHSKSNPTWYSTEFPLKVHHNSNYFISLFIKWFESKTKWTFVAEAVKSNIKAMDESTLDLPWPEGMHHIYFDQYPRPKVAYYALANYNAFGGLLTACKVLLYLSSPLRHRSIYWIGNGKEPMLAQSWFNLCCTEETSHIREASFNKVSFSSHCFKGNTVKTSLLVLRSCLVPLEARRPTKETNYSKLNFYSDFHWGA